MTFSVLQDLVISTLALLVALLCIKSWRSRKQSRPMDWPVLGFLPSVITGKFYDQITAILAANRCNMKVHGPAASGIRYFVTCDPANIRHIYTTNHANYPKGKEFAEIFDVYSGTILTVDGEPWRKRRGMYQSFLTNPHVLALMERSRSDKVVNGLLPFMTRMASTRMPFDLQDLINRLVFDLTAIPVFCVDPGYLPTTDTDDMPSTHAATALDTVMEVGLWRHIMPASCWKLMRRLNIGPERRMAFADKQLHGFVREMMEKREARSTTYDDDLMSGVDVTVAADPAYNDDGFLLSKALINYMVAGRDTMGTVLPWVFYSIAKNPRVVSAISKELAAIASLKKKSTSNNGTTNTMLFFKQEETKDLVYLHAALYESLRLYPPGPFARKKVLADDLLPSGHRVYSGETIVISSYAIGRMETVWGEDCHEYRPERWLSGTEDGKYNLVHVPAHKFMAFNSGPRMCPGKDVAMAQMKTIVAAVMWNFEVEVVDGQSVQPKLSCSLQMNNGLKVIVKKREEE